MIEPGTTRRERERVLSVSFELKKLMVQKEQVKEGIKLKSKITGVIFHVYKIYKGKEGMVYSCIIGVPYNCIGSIEESDLENFEMA